MDELVKKVSGLGLCGTLLVIAIAASGGNSAAVIACLAALGGPLGIVGGLGLFSLVGIIGEVIGEYGLENTAKIIYTERSKSESKQVLLKEIEELPISEALKLKLKDNLNSNNNPESGVPQEPRTVEVVEG